MDYPGIDGFLGTRASLMLDFVVLAMMGVLPIMAWSIAQAHYRRRYLLHKRIQIALAVVLAITVAVFETDVRINNWRPRAEASPYYGSADTMGPVFYVLYVHLFFAVSTVVLWGFVIWQALRRFPNPPRPDQHSRQHVFWGRLAAADMTLTAVTGWIFYYVAFVAT